MSESKHMVKPVWFQASGVVLTFLFLGWVWEAGHHAFVETEPALFASHGVWILLPFAVFGLVGSVMRHGRGALALVKLEVGLWGACLIALGLHLYLTSGARGSGSAFVEEVLFRSLDSKAWFALYLVAFNGAAVLSGTGLYRVLEQAWPSADARTRAFLATACGFLVWFLAVDTLSRYVAGAPLW